MCECESMTGTASRAAARSDTRLSAGMGGVRGWRDTCGYGTARPQGLDAVAGID